MSIRKEPLLLQKKHKLKEKAFFEVTAFGRLTDISQEDFYSGRVFEAIEANLNDSVNAIENGDIADSKKKEFDQETTERYKHEKVIFQSVGQTLLNNKQLIQDYQDGKATIKKLAEVILGKDKAELYNEMRDILDEILPEHRFAAESIKGTVFEERVNYFPKKAIGKLVQDEEGFSLDDNFNNENAGWDKLLGGFSGKEQPNPGKNTHSMERQQDTSGVFYENNAMALFVSYIDNTLAEVYLTEEVMTLKEMLTSEAMKKKIGADNVEVLKTNVIESIKNYKGRNIRFHHSSRLFSWMTRNIGASKLLSMVQVVNQTVPPFMAYIVSSPMAPIHLTKALAFLNSIDGLNWTETERTREWELGNEVTGKKANTAGLGIRNARWEREDLQGEFVKKGRVEKANSITKPMEDFLSPLLTRPDKIIARILYVAEAIESGVKDLNNMTDAEIAHAERMTENRLNVNNPNNAMPITIPKNDLHKILMSTFMMFRGFPLQNTVTNVFGGAKNSLRSKEARKLLWFSVAQGFVYAILGQQVLSKVYEMGVGALLESLDMGGEEGEEQIKREKKEEAERAQDRKDVMPRWLQEALVELVYSQVLGGAPEPIDNVVRIIGEDINKRWIEGEVEKGEHTIEYDKYADRLVFAPDYKKDFTKVLGTYGNLIPYSLYTKAQDEYNEDGEVSKETIAEVILLLSTTFYVVPADIQKITNKSIQNLKAQERAR